MENPSSMTNTFLAPSANNSSDMFSNKNMIIIVLVILLILSFLGINLLAIFGNLIQTIVAIFGPLVNQIFSIFGYTAGTVINKSADIAGDTAKAGIDIAEGTFHSVGNILRDASQGHVAGDAKASLDNALNNARPPLVNPPEPPKPDAPENPIQKPISSGKSGWCLVGEYKGRRGCIEVGEQDQCLSGQVYPEQKICLNPALSQNPPLPTNPPPLDLALKK
jgi:hypothetical protein